MGAIILTADQVRAKIAEALRDTIDDYRTARAKRDPNFERPRGTKDGGIDVVSTRVDPAVGALKAVWQAKRYGEGHKVQLSQARELSGVIERERASKGVLVTTTSLTRGTLNWVKQDEFRLSAKDGNEVRRWIEKYAD